MHPTARRNRVSLPLGKKDIKATHQTNERPIISTPDCTSSKSPHPQPKTPTNSSLSAFSMYPPARSTRSNNNPGVVNLPKSRRSPADVAADKAESKKIAAANAKKMRKQAAQVARVENKIRTAQKEAAYASGSQKKRVKKTFSREDIVEDSEVSLFQFSLDHSDSPCPQGRRH